MINDQHVGEVSTGNLTSQLDPDLQAFIDELTQQSFAVVAAPARLASPVAAVFAAPQGLLGHSGANGPLVWSFKRQGELKESWAATFVGWWWYGKIHENPIQSYDDHDGKSHC